MKNYQYILQELGIVVPDDKKEALKRAMNQNYRTINDYNKQIRRRNEEKIARDQEQLRRELKERIEQFMAEKQFVNQITELYMNEKLEHSRRQN